jgi:DNA repair protein RadC
MTYQIVSERKVKEPSSNMNHPDDIYELLKRYTKARQEQFLVVTVNSARKPISVVIVSIGTANKTQVHPRDVLYPAIRDNAVAIIVAHNHPSGMARPSTDDEELTGLLFDSCCIMGIQLLDHLIITKKGYYSFAENGKMKELEALRINL